MSLHTVKVTTEKREGKLIAHFTSSSQALAYAIAAHKRDDVTLVEGPDHAIKIHKTSEAALSELDFWSI